MKDLITVHVTLQSAHLALSKVTVSLICNLCIPYSIIHVLLMVLGYSDSHIGKGLAIYRH